MSTPAFKPGNFRKLVRNKRKMEERKKLNAQEIFSHANQVYLQLVEKEVDSYLAHLSHDPEKQKERKRVAMYRANKSIRSKQVKALLIALVEAINNQSV